MNKTLIYAGVGVAAVAVIAGVAFYSNKPGGSPASSPASMRELLAKGGSQKCTFSNSVENSESNGTVYMSGGKMRGDFVSVAGGKEIQSHMIVEGETAYIWSDMMAQGMKMSFAGMTGESTPSNGGVNMDQRLNYNCGYWAADQGKFMMPSGVTFVDLNAALPGASAGASAGAGAQCSQCEFITDSASKAQCRAALQCN